MAGGTLRRIVPVALVVFLLLPLAASAAPLERSEAPLAVRLADWSHALWAPVGELLQQLLPVFQQDSQPPGQKPGNDPKPDAHKNEGSGSDPHGKP